jgi:hypothetical protein
MNPASKPSSIFCQEGPAEELAAWPISIGDAVMTKSKEAHCNFFAPKRFISSLFFVKIIYQIVAPRESPTNLARKKNRRIDPCGMKE